MVSLELGQYPVVRPSYPHMMAEDREVWTRFLESKFIELKKVWYDLRVGSPIQLKEGADETDLKIASGLTRKRIDVVAEVGGGYWVIEVKPRATMYALGQVLTYTRLFVKEYKVSGEVVPVIICDEVDDDLLDEFDEFGVMVISV